MQLHISDRTIASRRAVGVHKRDSKTHRLAVIDTQRFVDFSLNVNSHGMFFLLDGAVVGISSPRCYAIKGNYVFLTKEIGEKNVNFHILHHHSLHFGVGHEH